MKIRAKVLLGLIVVLAMMVFAAPAMAEETQTSPNFTVSGIPDTLEVELGSEVKFNYTITKTDQTKELCYGDEDTLTAENRPAEGDEKLSFMHTPFQMEGDNYNTGEVIIKPDHVKQLGEHAFKFKITEHDDEHDPRFNPISEYEKVIKITVKPQSAVSLSASLSGYDTVTNGANQLTKTVGGVGVNTGLTASTTAQNPSYQWQKAADQRNAFEPNAENWEDIPNANTAALGNATDDMNGQYVRCVVTVGNEKMVATANESGLSNTAAVKIVFSNTTDLVCKVYATVNGQKREAQNEYQYIFFEWVDKKISDDGKLTAEASGGKGPYTYVWEKIEGEIDPKVAFSYMNELEIGTIGGLYDDGFVGTYRCKVTDSDNRTVYSKPIKFSYAKPQTLKIKQGECAVAHFVGIDDEDSAIYQDGGKGVVNVAEADLNKPLTLEAEATQRQPTGYKWYKNNTEIPNATSAKYTIPANEVKVGDKYKVEATFDNGLLSTLYCETEIKLAYQDNGPGQDSVEVKIFESVKVSETEAIAKEAPANKTFYIGETNHTFFPKVINDTDEGDHQYAYHWLKDGKDIALTDIVVSDIGDLFFDKITSNQYAGTYQCLVTENNVVVGRSPIITVQVAEGPAKQQPTKALYTMTPLKADYTGKAQKPTITPAEGAGAVEKVHYYLDGKEITGEPKDAGTYTVKIDTKANDNYEAATELELGTFTIKEKSDEPGKPDTPDKPDQTSEFYLRAHVENQGWDKTLTSLDKGQSVELGTTGLGRRVEAIDLVVPEDYKVIGFAHVQNEGDVAVTEIANSDAAFKAQIPEGYTVYRFGTTGKGERVEAVCIGIQDANGEYIKGLQYAAHLQNYGWQGFVRNGSFSGARGMGLRMETIRFAYTSDDVAKASEDQSVNTVEDPAQQDNVNTKADDPTIYISAHVQNKGWDKDPIELKKGGSVFAGTTGMGLRVEALTIMVPKDCKVIGFAHVQNEGDVAVKEVTSSSDYDIPEGYTAYEFGSTGKGQRVEAVCIGIQDANGEYIKGFQYATHLQNYGWQGYVRNGSFSGSRAMGLRMESLRFAYTDDDVVKAGEPK
ncbi:MAG: hypothetical protein IJH61_08435 [Eubacteriaceae bacterium]|nr:hypothetical protein [Eubacteriaceae bacterium]